MPQLYEEQERVPRLRSDFQVPESFVHSAGAISIVAHITKCRIPPAPSTLHVSYAFEQASILHYRKYNLFC
jgi:hypothetical protein